MKTIWILGASGRIGRAVAANLAADGQPFTLVGRDHDELCGVANKLGGHIRIKVLANVPDMAKAIAAEKPAVVVNLVGPFTRNALPIAKACPPGTHYVDLSNELPSVQAMLSLHEHASSTGCTFVTGAGFGVLATESVVLRLCEGLPPPANVRCTVIPAVVSEPGPLGEAFASSIIEGFAYGGRRYEGGHLVRSRLMDYYELLSVPDGRVIGTASVPTAELEAAKRASGAPFVISATSMVPQAAFLRAVLPPILNITKVPAVRRFVTRRLAAFEVKATDVAAAPVSWSHARVEWSSENLSEIKAGWMRTGDAMVFTANVISQVAIRLMKGGSKVGAYTPGMLFGANLANECGGIITLDVTQTA